MTRIITSIVFDLKFDASTTAPDVHVTFTDRADGHETEGRAALHDAAALRVFSQALLDAVNAEIDAQAKALAEPGTVAARVTAAAAAALESRRSVASAAKAKADHDRSVALHAEATAQLAAVTKSHEAKVAAIAELDAAIAAKRAQLDAADGMISRSSTP